MCTDHPWDHENLEVFEGLEDGDLRPLVDMLRAGRIPHPEVINRFNLIAEEEPEAGFHLRRAPRSRGRQAEPDNSRAVRDLIIGMWIHRSHTRGNTISSAKAKACTKFGLKQRTIDDVWTSYRGVWFRFIVDGDKLDRTLKPLRASRSGN